MNNEKDQTIWSLPLATHLHLTSSLPHTQPQNTVRWLPRKEDSRERVVALSCGAKLLKEREVQGSQYSDNFMHVQQLLVIQKELLSVITHTNCIFLARTDFIIHFVAVNKI